MSVRACVCTSASCVVVVFRLIQWDYLKSMSDDSGDGPEGVSGGSASPAAAAAAVPESTPTKAELDDIYDLISQDAAKTDSDK